MPEVSVIIPAYNQGRYLGEAIHSVLNQTYKDFEIIIVDDGSTDNTQEVANAYSDARVRYIYQENRGLSAARNTGIRNSSGKYLTFLDSDDLFLADKLRLLVSEMEAHPEIGLIAGQAIPINQFGCRIGRIFDKPLPDDPCRLLLGNPIHVGSALLLREWQEKVGYFDENLRSYEDWDMWLRLARVGCKIGWVAKPVSLYRFHTEQMTRIGAQMTEATFAVLDKVFCDPGLERGWLEMRDLAYGNAYLRAAAQAYFASDFSSAKDYLNQAVSRNPELLSDHAQGLANRFYAWTQLPKTKDSIGYLERIYNNLPENLAVLSHRRNRDLGYAAISKAFEAYHQGDYQLARRTVFLGLRYRPRYFCNRGVLSILLRSSIKALNLQG